MDHFLRHLGYDFATVPPDYTVVPPSDIQKVRSNLTLITQCLQLSSSLNDDGMKAPLQVMYLHFSSGTLNRRIADSDLWCN